MNTLDLEDTDTKKSTECLKCRAAELEVEMLKMCLKALLRDPSNIEVQEAAKDALQDIEQTLAEYQRSTVECLN